MIKHILLLDQTSIASAANSSAHEHQWQKGANKLNSELQILTSCKGVTKFKTKI